MKGEWCYFHKKFTKDFCEKIISEIKESELFSPSLGFGGEGLTDGYRAGKITWLDRNTYEYVYDEIWKLVRIANEQWFNFHIIGTEKIQFSKYDSSKRGYYKKHHDVFWLTPEETHRKITCVIQLSDPNSYEGGNLLLHDCSEYPNFSQIRDQGTVIFFPSFIFHEVEEVFVGTRYSLVCWIYGPKWR